MRSEQIAGLLDRMHNRIDKILRFEMRLHRLDQLLPERFVADNGKFLRARRDENQDAVALAGPRHTEFRESRPCRHYGVGNFSALDKDADLAEGFSFGGAVASPWLCIAGTRAPQRSPTNP
jgi:hypothetical protein